MAWVLTHLIQKLHNGKQAQLFIEDNATTTTKQKLTLDQDGK